MSFLHIHRIFDCLLSRFLNRYCHDSQKILLKNVEIFDQTCFRKILNCEYSIKKNRDNKSEMRVECLKNVDKTLQIDFQKMIQMIFFFDSINNHQRMWLFFTILFTTNFKIFHDRSLTKTSYQANERIATKKWLNERVFKIFVD